MRLFPKKEKHFNQNQEQLLADRPKEDIYDILKSVDKEIQPGDIEGIEFRNDPTEDIENLRNLLVDEEGIQIGEAEEYQEESKEIIEETRKKIDKSFESGLEDMFKANIITKEQKEEIENSLKSPQVKESIKTWLSVFSFSSVYIVVNTVTITPLAGIIGGGGLAAAGAWIVMYILKRFLVSGIVSKVGKNLTRKKYIANMSMVPILGEHISLIELYRSHPLAAQYYFAFKRTKQLRKNYLKAGEGHQERAARKRERAVNKNAKWLKGKSDRLVNFETNIANFFIGLRNRIAGSE